MKEKIWNWWKEKGRVEITGAALLAGGFLIGGIVSELEKHHRYKKINQNMQMLNRDGYLIYTEPTYDGSVPRYETNEWLTLIKEHYGTKD